MWTQPPINCFIIQTGHTTIETVISILEAQKQTNEDGRALQQVNSTPIWRVGLSTEPRWVSEKSHVLCWSSNWNATHHGSAKWMSYLSEMPTWKTTNCWSNWIIQPFDRNYRLSWTHGLLQPINNWIPVAKSVIVVQMPPLLLVFRNPSWWMGQNTLAVDWK